MSKQRFKEVVPADLAPQGPVPTQAPSPVTAEARPAPPLRQWVVRVPHLPQVVVEAPDRYDAVEVALKALGVVRTEHRPEVVEYVPTADDDEE